MARATTLQPPNAHDSPAMNEALFTMGLLPGLFMLAGIYDVLTGRIPDWISVSLVAVFLAYSFLIGFSIETVAWHAAIGLLVFFAGFVVFALGWMGGGDGKLAAAGALWFGPAQIQEFFIVSFIYGAALVAVMFVLRRIPLPPILLRQEWFVRWLDGNEGLPFGLAMAGSVLTIIG